MAEQIHLAVVAVAEAAVGDGRPHSRGEVAERLDTDVAATAQDGAREAGTGELRAGDDADRDAGRRRPLERRRHGLHLLGRRGVAQIVAPGVLAPPQRVEDADAGQPEREADHSMLARPAAGADRGRVRPPWSTEIRPAASGLAARPSPGRRRRRRRGVPRPARRSGARMRRGPRLPARYGRRTPRPPSPPAPTAPRRPDGECAGLAAAGPHRETAILFPLCRCG